jgi:hypothetical protein
MSGLLTFIVALLWGSFSAQFLVQVITSAILAGVTISGLAFSKVDNESPSNWWTPLLSSGGSGKV